MTTLAGAAALASAMAGPAQSQDITRKVKFAPGATSTTLKGAIRGRAGVNYTVDIGQGQTMQSLFTTSNRSCYFNVYEPGAAAAAHIGSTSGNEFGQNPTRAGTYRFQVYMMRNAARRNETCRYSLSLEITGRPGGVRAVR